jgi:hypothetical protein
VFEAGDARAGRVDAVRHRCARSTGACALRPRLTAGQSTAVVPPCGCWRAADTHTHARTGSKDGTPKLAEKFFKKAGVPGTVAHHKWKDFSANRNLCIEVRFGGKGGGEADTFTRSDTLAVCLSFNHCSLSCLSGAHTPGWREVQPGAGQEGWPAQGHTLLRLPLVPRCRPGVSGCCC